MSTNTLDFDATYTILGVIGKGGGGTVYKAYHKRLKKEVVLKKIHKNLTEINARNEADILKNLKSPYMPQVIDFIEHDGDVYTVMEYVEGKSMKNCMAEGMHFYQKDALKWFRQLAEALLLLHSQNPMIIHGDIKPDNIMLTPQGDVCLIDFNVSSIFDGKYNQVAGYTPAYAAPEQISFYHQVLSLRTREKTDDLQDETECTEPLPRETVLKADDLKNDIELQKTEAVSVSDKPMGNAGKRRQALIGMQSNIDARTDIYSLGITMYHIISGKRLERSSPQNIRELLPGMYETFAYIVMKCVQNAPEDRFQSAEELLDALNNVYTSTQSYKGLIVRQRAVRGILLVLTVASCMLTYYGLQRIQQERDIAYNHYVKKEAEARLEGNEKILEKAFKKAINISQMSADAYIEKGWYFYDHEKYEDAISFLLEESAPYIKDNKGLSNIYYLVGKSYAELEEYSKAHEMFQKALQYDTENSSVYQEDAIVMARTGKTKAAKKRLAEAKKYGLESSGIDYTDGEIAYSESDMEQAEKDFHKAITETDDEYLKMRAYMMLARIYKDEDKTVENCDERITLLTEAKENVDEQYQNAIIQELAQAYIDRSALNNSRDDALEAVNLLQNVIDNGYGNYDTYQTIETLYHNFQMYDEEEAELKEMLQVFGEDYRTYMHFAYLEAARQNQLANASRSYRKFDEYYQKASEIYGSQKKENQSDPLMENLTTIYQDVKSGGWI